MQLARSCPSLSLANLLDHDVSLALKTFLADTDRRRKVGWTVVCLKSGSDSLIESFVEGRKVVLIVDNCPAHQHVEGLKAIHLMFLLPNTTSKTQPIDQGVIRSIKAHYRALSSALHPHSRQ